jgi:radical SAM protein with 4Fe4S-binding SPASM domain
METTAFQRQLSRLAESFHPTNAHWDLTSRCNASCKYCFIRDNSRADLPTAQMLAIADFLDDNGILFLTLSGGEIFLRPDILPILQRVIENDFFWVSILTNGLVMEQKHIDFFAGHPGRFTDVQLSVFSHIPALNDRYFGVPGALEKILTTGHALQDAGVPVRLGINLFDFNLNDIRATRAFFKSEGFTLRVSLTKIVSDHNRPGVPVRVLNRDFFRACLAALDDDIVQPLRDEMANNLSGRSATDQLCGGLKNFIAVDPAGNVHPCPVYTMITVGHALDGRSIVQMLTASPQYREIRDLTKRSVPVCRQCRFGNFCEICLAGRTMDTGDYRKPRRQTCEFARAVYDFCYPEGRP